MRVVLLLLVFPGCTYDSDRFLAVCSDGKGYDRAALHEPGAASDADYPIAIVKRWANLPGKWVLDTPKRIYSAGITAPSSDNYRRVQLALCVDQQAGGFNRDCEMEGGVKVEAYDTHYVLTVREARTARVLATRSVDVKVKECPIVVLGRSRAELARPDYVEISDEELAATLAPHLPPLFRTRLGAPPPSP